MTWITNYEVRQMIIIHFYYWFHILLQFEEIHSLLLIMLHELPESTHSLVFLTLPELQGLGRRYLHSLLWARRSLQLLRLLHPPDPGVLLLLPRHPQGPLPQPQCPHHEIHHPPLILTHLFHHCRVNPLRNWDHFLYSCWSFHRVHTEIESE